MLIVDLDGTLFDNSHRAHLVPRSDQHKPKAWTPFNSACGDDTPNLDLIRVIRTNSLRHNVVFLTGRDEDSRAPTEKQLKRYFNRCEWDLNMRPMDEGRSGHEFKRDILPEIIAGESNIIMWDDDERVVNMVVKHFPQICILKVDMLKLNPL